MGSVIRLSDHIETKQLNSELAQLSKSVEKLSGDFNEIITETKKVNQGINQNSKSFTGANKAVEKTSRNLNQLTALQKERVKIQTQTRATLAKVQVLDERRNKTLQKGKTLLQARNKLARQEAQLNLLRTKEGQKLNKQLSQQNAELKKLKGSGGGLQKVLTSLGFGFLGITAAIAAVVKGVTSYIKLTREVNKQTGQVAATFGVAKEEAKGLTVEVRKLSTAFDKEFNDVLKSANVLAKEFGITADEALDLINQGFQKGADVNGEFLELLKEYPGQLKTVGLNAEETIAIITQTERAGVFSDKGIDAIKEAGIRLRELTPATKEALNAIGLSGEEIENSLRDGSKTLFQVTQEVSARLSQLPPQSKEVGTAIADIFGGPGEDAGLRFLTTLKDIDLSLEDIESTLSEDEKATVRLRMAWEELRTTSVGNGGVMAAIKNGLANLVIAVTNFRNNFVENFNDLIRSSTFFRTAIAVLGNAVKLNFRLMIDSVLLAIEPFIALGKIVKDVLKGNFDEVKETALEGLDAIRGRAVNLGSNFIDTGQNIRDAFTGDSMEKFLLKTKEVNDEVINLNENIAETAKVSNEVNNQIKESAENLTEGLATENERQLLSYKEKSLGILEDETITQEKKAELLKLASEEFLLQQVETLERELENIKLADDERVQLETELTEKKIELSQARAKAQEEESALIEDIKRAEQETLIAIGNELFNFAQTLLDREIANIEKQKKQGVISEEKAAKEIAQIRREQAIAAKAQGIFNAVINTAQGISAALGLGPIGVALAVLIGILGGVQVAAIAAEPIPQFAKGVKDFEGGAAIVGEEGSELLRLPGGDTALTPERATLMNLPKGTDVIPHHETKEILGGTTPSKWDELIKEQRATRKALSNQTVNQTIVTEKGFNYVTKKGSERVKWINRYLNR